MTLRDRFTRLKDKCEKYTLEKNMLRAKELEYDIRSRKNTTGLITTHTRIDEAVVREQDSDTVTDIDGNKYKTITIGKQVWMAENLKVIHYRNGDAIPNVADTNNEEWARHASGAYWEYNNDVNNVAIYGRLYNWYAGRSNRNIAPIGWHVPTDSEWKTLINYLGGEAVAGGKMKEAGTTHWISPNTGATNESRFAALPSGCRLTDGDYIGLGKAAYFWSKTNKGIFPGYFAWSRYLECVSSNIYRSSDIGGKHIGFSIRCVKD